VTFDPIPYKSIGFNPSIGHVVNLIIYYPLGAIHHRGFIFLVVFCFFEQIIFWNGYIITVLCTGWRGQKSHKKQENEAFHESNLSWREGK
jgi:hypothetical protein